jgi:hypothetical protein
LGLGRLFPPSDRRPPALLEEDLEQLSPKHLGTPRLVVVRTGSSSRSRGCRPHRMN